MGGCGVWTCALHGVVVSSSSFCERAFDLIMDILCCAGVRTPDKIILDGIALVRDTLMGELLTSLGWAFWVRGNVM
jgi:hypothetical protein